MRQEDQPNSEDLDKLLEEQDLDENRLRAYLETLHPIDLAEFLDDAELRTRVRVFQALDPAVAAQVFAAMPHEYRIALIDGMGEERLAPIIERLPDDVVTDVIQHLPLHQEKSILSRMEKDRAEGIRQLRQHPPHTAGGRMTTNFVAVPESFTAAEVLKAIQGAVDAETIEYVYVVDEKDYLRGVSSVAGILRSEPQTPIAQFMHRDVTFVGASLDQEEVARIAKRQNLRAIPVVDERMNFIGVVTQRNLLQVLQQEADEDALKLAGAGTKDLLRAPFLERLRGRTPWLAGCLGLELLVSWVMKGYGHTLDRLVLVYFIPAIMAMGGNVGLQSATGVVRGLATGDVTLIHWRRVLFAEFRVGLAIGLLAASTIAIAAFLLSLPAPDAVGVAAVVFVSMSISLTTAASFGSYLPFFMRKLRRDPAVASGPFVTGFNDLLNVTIYLTVATLFLPAIPHA